MSVDGWRELDLANPTEEHGMLRQMVRDFVAAEVEPQALEHDREEKFNLDLFRKLGDLGLLGITVQEEYGGAGMDAVAAAIVNEELSYSDPGLCLAYLAHSMLFANNLARNGSEEQKQRVLPKVCSGDGDVRAGYRHGCPRHVDLGCEGWRSLGHQRPQDVDHQRLHR